jgi:hypothetical protein
MRSLFFENSRKKPCPGHAEEETIRFQQIRTRDAETLLWRTTYLSPHPLPVPDMGTRGVEDAVLEGHLLTPRGASLKILKPENGQSIPACRGLAAGNWQVSLRGLLTYPPPPSTRHREPSTRDLRRRRRLAIDTECAPALALLWLLSKCRLVPARKCRTLQQTQGLTPRKA